MNVSYNPTLTDRELRWLRHIAVHGPQSSEFLLEVCADTHRCRDTGLRALKRLREAGFLRLPPQQKLIAKADFNPFVYDLTKQAEMHLKGLGDPQTIRPTGHWWHAHLTSGITSAIAIECQRRGYRFIPAHEILNRCGATLAISADRQKLIPDQLFAIDYGGTYRSFVLEVDRGTEPYRSEAARKSLARSIEHYAGLTKEDALRRHYGLKSPLLVLMAFTAPARAAKCLEVLHAAPASFSATVLVSVVLAEFPRVGPVRRVVSEPWRRAQDGAVGVFL